MNKIGFKNFRRFQNFEPINYKGITFLVGKNNSGKSTLVKALLLVVDYLKADKIGSFSFNQNNIEDVNIVTFKRALNKIAKQKNEDFITFEYEFNEISFSLTITGNDDDTTVEVIGLTIEDLDAGFKYTIKPKESSITMENVVEKFGYSYDSERDVIAKLQENEKEINNKLKLLTVKTSPEYISCTLEVKQIKKKISDQKKRIDILSKEGEYNLFSLYNSNSLNGILQEAVIEHSAEYGVQYHDIQGGKKAKKSFEPLKAFKDDKFKIEKSITSIVDSIDQIENIYLGATLNKQSALFAIRDKKNPLSQAINEYKQLGIDLDSGSEAFKFVQKWINEDAFEIGKSFTIEMHAGEAYEVIVKSNNVEIPLADKGMGSIQAMLLILRLATIIYKKQKTGKIYTIIIEEPELNLHPALQSKLADLFDEVNQNFGINFIIETHSEYLIRKTQLIVKENEYEVKPNENPFTVVYFDKDFTQWPMNYREDGKFIEKFGTGFFDVSANLVFDLL